MEKLICLIINTIQSENHKIMMKRSKHAEIWFSHKKYVPLQHYEEVNILVCRPNIANGMQ
jgi:hypothetical protein